MNPKLIVVGLACAALWCALGSAICIILGAAGWAIGMACGAVWFSFAAYREAQAIREDREYYRHPRL